MSGTIEAAVQRIVNSIKTQMESRTVRASNELKNSELNVIQGQGSGRVYRVPSTGGYYQASAPGEVPAVRTGAFRNSWQAKAEGSGDVFHAKIESNLHVNGYLLGEILENGTPGGKIAPRPHHQKILDDAEPKITRIYSEPYVGG